MNAQRSCVDDIDQHAAALSNDHYGNKKREGFSLSSARIVGS